MLIAFAGPKWKEQLWLSEERIVTARIIHRTLTNTLGHVLVSLWQFPDEALTPNHMNREFGNER